MSENTVTDEAGRVTDFCDLMATLALMIETELQTSISENRVPFNVDKVERFEDDEQITYVFKGIKRPPEKVNDKFNATSDVVIIKTKADQPVYVERVLLVIDDMHMGEFTHISGKDIYNLAEKAYDKYH